MSVLISILSGILFAVGLVISGMTNPNKVIGFLDILGNWDYSLAFVMVGAISVSFVAFKYFQNKKPFCAPQSFLPTNTEVDKKLLIGSAMFGIGWGIAGFCPGPAIVNLATFDMKAIVFVIAMVVGMFVFKLYSKTQ
ncbi:MAG: YeeE/YedE family protein [Oligoflexia bacterium]|nr:YeeE/YedE family protein [Oligoflexia bacterium]